MTFLIYSVIFWLFLLCTVFFILFGSFTLFWLLCSKAIYIYIKLLNVVATVAFNIYIVVLTVCVVLFIHVLAFCTQERTKLNIEHAYIITKC